MALISGCELGMDEDDGYRYEGTLASVIDWRSREAPYEYQADGVIDVQLALGIRDQVYAEIEYDYEKKDLMYLQDSAETEELGRGVCNDRHALIYMRLRQEGFPDCAIGLVEFSRPSSDINHVVCAIFPTGDRYDESAWILLGTLQEDHYPILGYNLFDFWEYPQA